MKTIIPVETTPGIGEGRRRRMVEEVNSCMIYLIHCDNLCKCHNVPPPITTIKEKTLNTSQKISMIREDLL
jgi:hypothetical protein